MGGLFLMADLSYVFDFSRVPSFFEQFNNQFFTDEMYQTIDEVASEEDVGNNFELVWASYGDGSNIDNYLDDYGGLNDTVTIQDVMDCALDYIRDENGDATIGLKEAVTFNIGDDNIPLKALFLRCKSTGYVMGYCINTVSFTVTNKAVFDKSVIFWDITRLSYGG